MPTYRKHLKHSAAIRPEVYMLEDDPAVADLLCLEDDPNMEVTIERLGEMLRKLDSRARMVLLVRYGIGGGSQQSLRATSQQLGLSLSQVRSAERRALSTLTSFSHTPFGTES
jgi:DNA-directed RNA polymerase sigma subunit (sigma70/sigma32)